MPWRKAAAACDAQNNRSARLALPPKPGAADTLPIPGASPPRRAGVGARGGQVGHERGAPHLAASAAVVARVAVATAVADGRGSCGSGCSGGSVSSDGCGGGGGDAQSCRLRAAGHGRRAGGARRRRPR